MDVVFADFVQGARGQAKERVRSPHPDRTPQYCQVSQVANMRVKIREID